GWSRHPGLVRGRIVQTKECGARSRAHTCDKPVDDNDPRADHDDGAPMAPHTPPGAPLRSVPSVIGVAGYAALSTAESPEVSNVIVARGAALSAVPVGFVALLSVVILLCVRAWGGVVGVKLTPLVTKLLDGSIALVFVLFVVVVIFRFTTIG